MEGKQLNLNAPLLSARRYSSPSKSSDRLNTKVNGNSQPARQHSLPVCRSDLDIAEVTKPAAVPFTWEQTPGRPKREISQSGPLENLGNSPRLPPGRTPEILRFRSGELLYDRSMFKSHVQTTPVNDHAAIVRSLTESLYTREDSDIESGDDDYSDAVDALSPSDTMSMNCSISGLSDSNGTDIKQSGSFSVDPATREFMMNRFLPAAKAVVLDLPQYSTPRKQPTVIEPLKHVKKIVAVERKPPIKQPVLNVPSDYAVDTASEDENEDCGNIPVKHSRKFWKFLPKICVKNSLCLLNPLPALKERTQRVAPRTSSMEVPKLTRKAFSGPLDKHAYNSAYKKTYRSGFLSGELNGVKDKLSSEAYKISYSRPSFKADGLSGSTRPRSVSPYRNQAPPSPFHAGASGELNGVKNKLTSEANMVSYSRPSFKADSLSSSTRPRSVSPYRNQAPPSPFHEGARFLGLPKEHESVKANNVSSFSKAPLELKDTKSYRICKEQSDLGSDGVEKTVYVDSINNERVPIPSSASSVTERTDSSFENLKILDVTNQVEMKTHTKASAEKVMFQNYLDRGNKIDPKLNGSPDDKVPVSYVYVSKLSDLDDKAEGFKGHVVKKETKSLDSSKDNINHSVEKLDGKDDVNIQPDNATDSKITSLQSPLPPPLPKSPSESWLWRTLPSISLPNPFLYSRGGHFQKKKQGKESPVAATKWETMVKISNRHQDHIRFSEELTPRISRQKSQA